MMPSPVSHRRGNNGVEPESVFQERRRNEARTFMGQSPSRRRRGAPPDRYLPGRRCPPEHSQRQERSRSRDPPHPGRDLLDLCLSQRLPHESAIRQVHQHKYSCIHEHRNRRQSSIRDPRRRERHQRHHEQVREVHPDQARRRMLGEPQQMMVIHPDDGDEQVADRTAQCSGPTE